MFVDIINMFIL